MKHALAALAISWTLISARMHTYPKDGQSHLFLLPGIWDSVQSGFPTKTACEASGVKWKSDFIKDADAKNLEIYGDFDISCVGTDSDQPAVSPK